MDAAFWWILQQPLCVIYRVHSAFWSASKTLLRRTLYRIAKYEAEICHNGAAATAIAISFAFYDTAKINFPNYESHKFMAIREFMVIWMEMKEYVTEIVQGWDIRFPNDISSSVNWGKRRSRWKAEMLPRNQNEILFSWIEEFCKEPTTLMFDWT